MNNFNTYWYVQSFLSKENCDKIIELGKSKTLKSAVTLGDDEKSDDSRVSQSELTHQQLRDKNIDALYSIAVYDKSLNKIYFIGSGGCGDQTNNINTNLFNGDKTLNNENFRFCITGNSNSYTARAYSKNNNNNFYITNKNEKNF